MNKTFKRLSSYLVALLSTSSFYAGNVCPQKTVAPQEIVPTASATHDDLWADWDWADPEELRKDKERRKKQKNKQAALTVQTALGKKN
jgi:hypothetical protein